MNLLGLGKYSVTMDFDTQQCNRTAFVDLIIRDENRLKRWGHGITEVPKLADPTYAHNQSMSIGCIGKLGHLFGLLRHYLLSKKSEK